MATYYSTFPSGFGTVVEKAINKDLKEIKILENLDGLIEFTTESDISKIKSLPYLNNVFQIIYKLKTKSKNPLLELADGILEGKVPDKYFYIGPSNHNRTFRVVTSYENDLVSIESAYLQKIENYIKRITGLHVNRSKPDFQFWLLSRSEGVAYFSLRLTRIQQSDKQREKGELRPQIAALLLLLAELQHNELLLDPFCGSGSIPIAGYSMIKKGLILASDNDEAKISQFKAKVKSLKMNDKIIVRKDDALNLSRYTENSIHRIVTDPPWGHYDKIINTDEFYNAMLQEFWRILVPNGFLIVLIANNGEFENILKNFASFSIIERLNVLISGKKAMIYKLRK